MKKIALPIVALLAALVLVAAYYAFRAPAPARPGPVSPLSLPPPPTPDSAALPPGSPPKGSEEQDHFSAGPVQVQFTDAQQQELAKLRQRFGELQVQIASSERESDLVRAQSMGLPAVKAGVAAIRESVDAVQKMLLEYPGRAAADAAVAAKEPPALAARRRLELFAAHIGTHLTGKPDEAERAVCEWCVRDAARIAAKDPELGKAYHAEDEKLTAETKQAGDALRAAHAAVRELAKQARASAAAQAQAQQEAAARQSLDTALEAVPAYAELRKSATEARREQVELSARIADVYAKGRFLTNVVASAGNAPKPGQKP